MEYRFASNSDIDYHSLKYWEELRMKKMNKKVVIATSVSVASMLLNAACGYGPPVEVEEEYSNSNYEISVEQDTTQDGINNQGNTNEQ
jgi:hypothetical protein